MPQALSGPGIPLPQWVPSPHRLFRASERAGEHEGRVCPPCLAGPEETGAVSRSLACASALPVFLSFLTPGTLRSHPVQPVPFMDGELRPGERSARVPGGTASQWQGSSALFPLSLPAPPFPDPPRPPSVASEVGYCYLVEDITHCDRSPTVLRVPGRLLGNGLRGPGRGQKPEPSTSPADSQDAMRTQRTGSGESGQGRRPGERTLVRCLHDE